MLLLIDVICHGVPSSMLFKDHIDYCEAKSGKTVDRYFFRYKNGNGQTQQTIIYDDGTVDSSSKYVRLYFDFFNENKILRDSCFNCPFASEERKSDITIGDYWGC